MPYKRRCQPVLQRRDAIAGPSAFSDWNSGLELGEIRPQNEQSNGEEPATNVSSGKIIMRNSVLRLVDSIVPQIGAEEQTLFRIIWVMIYVGLFVIFAHTFRDLIDKYNKYPTTFDLTVETGAKLQFPVVTLCNENPIKKKRINYPYWTDLELMEEFVSSLPSQLLAQDESGQLSENSCPRGWLNFLNYHSNYLSSTAI